MPRIPVNIGRRFGEVTNAMIMNAPHAMPAAPTPAIARPTIRTGEFGATPQIKLPNSKIKIAIAKVVLSGKYLNNFPHVD